MIRLGVLALSVASLFEMPAASARTPAPAKPADAELVRLATLYLQACVTRDADYVVAHSLDDPAGSFTGIGSGTGTDWSLAYASGHLRGLKQVGWEGLDPTGYVVGDVAWFSDLADGILPDGQRITIRISLVMRRVAGDWKAVHYQVSEGVDHHGLEKGR